METTPRKRRTPEELATYHQERADAAKQRVADKAAREAQRKEEEELKRKQKVLGALDATGIGYVERGLDSVWRIDPHAAGDARLIRIISDMRGEATDE